MRTRDHLAIARCTERRYEGNDELLDKNREACLRDDSAVAFRPNGTAQPWDS
jgi:hypothetical protein